MCPDGRVKKANSVTLILPTGNPTDSHFEIDDATQLVRALVGRTEAVASSWLYPGEVETATKNSREHTIKVSEGGHIPSATVALEFCARDEC